MTRRLAFLALLLLAGCASSPTEPGLPLCSAPDTTWAPTGEQIITHLCIGLRP